MKKQLLIFLSITIPFCSIAQNFGMGASAMYNFQSEGIGFGVRGTIFPDNTLSFSPQVSYYPGFNKVTEYTIGLGVEYKVFKGYTFNYYVMAHGGYNSWLNPEESTLENAQPANWNAEGGVGITMHTCFRPFLEYRYNIKFQETHLRVGFIYVFGCGGGNGYTCPAYN